MVVIIDYNMGNIASVIKAFKKIGTQPIVSNKKDIIEKAKYLVLPGVGAFGDGMKNLKELGLIELLNKKVIQHKTPFLGICLGMQLIAKTGYEFGTHSGIGWIDGQVIKLKVNKKLRLPHIGWNNIKIKSNHNLFDKIKDNNFYFVHSYHLTGCSLKIVNSTCNYGQEFISTIQQENIFATQFHPEKSQDSGLQLLRNFLNYQYA